MCPNYGGESCYQISKGNKPLLVKCLDLMNSYRKPGAGMIELAIAGFSGLEIVDRWMIGDRSEDKECAAAADIKFVWASIVRAKFTSGMKEIPCTHIGTGVLIEFLNI